MLNKQKHDNTFQNTFKLAHFPRAKYNYEDMASCRGVTCLLFWKLWIRDHVFLTEAFNKEGWATMLIKKCFFSFFILDITQETSSLLFTCLTLSPLSPDPLHLQNEAANLCLTSKCFCDKKIWMYEGYSLWPLLDSCVTFIWKSDGLYLNFCKIYFSMFVEKEQ